MNKVFACFCLAVLFPVLTYSQKSPEKFGKNIEEHLRSTICPIDSSAGAYVVFDFANLHYDYSTQTGFSWIQERHMRIKILNKNELGQGSFSILLNNLNSGSESVIGLKGASYNLKDGKIVTSKLSRRDAITENRSEKTDLYKFALPNVEEGTLIEVYYKLQSPFPYYLRNWIFQRDIPVLHSETYMGIPEFYRYHQNMKGYNTLTKGNTTTKSASLNLGENNDGTPNTRMYSLSCKHYIANDLPALKEENYVDNIENYRSAIEFELYMTKFDLNVTEYATDWEAVANKLLESNHFGSKMNRVAYAKEDLEVLMAKYTDRRELLNEIYAFVQNKLKWNGSTGFYSNQTLRQVYKDGTGRAPDINFILLNMLREANFIVYPVALSTRSNGFLFPAFPTMDNFNYMVPLVILDEEEIILDASSKHCPPGVVPQRCLNGKGRIIDKIRNSWVEIKPNESYTKQIMYDLSITELGEFSGSSHTTSKGYASIVKRDKIDDALSIEKMIEDMEEASNGLEILSDEIVGLDVTSGPVVENYDVEITDMSDFMGDLISFNPMLFEQMDENPFKLEERKFPVNFSYPRNYLYVYKYKLPDGYTAESVPDPINIVTSDKKAKFIYSSSVMSDFISISVMFQINKDVYLPAEYDELKQFFNMIVAKQGEQVIIKKASMP